MKLICILLSIFTLDLTGSALARDAWKWPFTPQSIWNMPIGSGAVYVPANLKPAKHVGVDTQFLVTTSKDDPEQEVHLSPGWEQHATGTESLGFKLRVPDNWIIPDTGKDNPYGRTPNANYAILQPDGKSVLQGCRVCRPGHGGPVYLPRWMKFPANRETTSLFGDGFDGGGQGASAMSSIGGTLRRGELTGPNPIRHVIKINPYANRYCYYSDAIPGWRWPAKKADGYAKERYQDKTPKLVMGSLLAIPPEVKLADLDLKTAAGKKLFFALQNYGAYFTEDAAWDTWDLIVEQGAEIEFTMASVCGVRRGWGK